MKLIVDAQLPRELVELFRSLGLECAHVWDRGTANSDGAIWREAVTESEIVVTKDRDFVQRRRRNPGPQILWLRVGNCLTPDLLAQVSAGWLDAKRRLRDGESIVPLP